MAATSPSVLSSNRGTWKRPLAVGLALVIVFWVCLALFVLAGDHGSGSAGKVGTSSQASLKTFARYWWGHGRGLHVYRSGRGREFARASLNRPPFNATLTFEVISVSGARTAADARIRVISVQNAHHTFPQVRVGQIGTMRLRHGIVTDTLTRGTYCAPHVDRCGL